MLFLVIITVPALCHRWGTQFLGRSVLGWFFATGLIVATFSAPSHRGFDLEHPQRVLCLYMENITSHELTLHVGGIDSASTLFQTTVNNTAERLSLGEIPVVENIGDDIPDWDIVRRLYDMEDQSFRLCL